MSGTLTRIISPIPLEHPTSLLPIFWTIASTRPVRILPTLDGARTDHHHLRIRLCPSILILLPRALVVCHGHPVPSFRLTALIRLWNPHTEHSMCHTTIFPISNHGAQRTFLPAMLHTHFRPPPMATTSKAARTLPTRSLRVRCLPGPHPTSGIRQDPLLRSRVGKEMMELSHQFHLPRICMPCPISKHAATLVAVDFSHATTVLVRYLVLLFLFLPDMPTMFTMPTISMYSTTSRSNTSQ
jgi:hypothetical protein